MVDKATEITVQDLANMINSDCEQLRFFWAYGLMKETINIWKNEDHRKLLCNVACIMYEQIVN